jgi:hypothetical protein
MKVYNIEIPQSAIDASIARMKQQGSFTANVITNIILDIMGASGNDGVAYRAADRIIQKQRKLLNIGPSDPMRASSHYWRWIAK